MDRQLVGVCWSWQRSAWPGQQEALFLLLVR